MCRNCESKMFEVVEDIKSGKRLVSSDFRTLDGGIPKDGTKIICPNCGSNPATIYIRDIKEME